MTKVLVLYHSTYGHIETMANAVADGARATGALVDIRRVPETVPQEIAEKSHYKLDQAAPLATIDDLPVWRIEGRWNPAMLVSLLPAQKEAALQEGGVAATQLPDGTPWSVRLSIGKRDLFPFRIEWLAIPGRRPVANGEPEPVAVLELYDVRLGEPVDAAAFVYKPATEGLIDLTEARAMQLAPMRP
jgi:hypothetical protein